jgi:hypothetical protein
MSILDEASLAEKVAEQVKVYERRISSLADAFSEAARKSIQPTGPLVWLTHDEYVSLYRRLDILTDEYRVLSRKHSALAESFIRETAGMEQAKLNMDIRFSGFLAERDAEIARLKDLLEGGDGECLDFTIIEGGLCPKCGKREWMPTLTHDEAGKSRVAGFKCICGNIEDIVRFSHKDQICILHGVSGEEFDRSVAAAKVSDKEWEEMFKNDVPVGDTSGAGGQEGDK